MNNSPRGRGSEKAQGSPDLHHLTLVELRAYRTELSDEEERVSYWRRLVQARLDVLRASSKGVDALTLPDLVKALGSTGTGVRRQGLLVVRASPDPLPELPVLGELWSAGADPSDPEKAKQVVDALTDAEQRLTTYRGVLHDRLSEATSELIARYAVDPTACLDLLPLDASK